MKGTTLSPAEKLTQPSIGWYNSGVDNKDSDLIVSVGDVLCSDLPQHHGPRRRYQVMELLGQGTFGQVVRCLCLDNQQFYAVKIIKSQPAYYNQAKIEIRMLQKVGSMPGSEGLIVRMHDYFQQRRHLCIVFELLGKSLYEILKLNKYKGLSLQFVQSLVRQVLDALILIRDAHIIHCDIKPENILLKSNDSVDVKVIDMGSACLENETIFPYIQSRYYRAPEVLVGHHYTAAIDVWSLGCVALELFFGMPLFPGASEFDMLIRITEMFGTLPNVLLNHGRNVPKYFKPEGGTFRLYSLVEFEQANSKAAVIGKRYFEHRQLQDLIDQYPYSDKLSDEELSAERNAREAFLDFLQGCLDLNPDTRWTPSQARQHPFITGERYIGPFQPPLESPRPMLDSGRQHQLAFSLDVRNLAAQPIIAGSAYQQAASVQLQLLAGRQATSFHGTSLTNPQVLAILAQRQVLAQSVGRQQQQQQPNQPQPERGIPIASYLASRPQQPSQQQIGSAMAGLLGGSLGAAHVGSHVGSNLLQGPASFARPNAQLAAVASALAVQQQQQKLGAHSLGLGMGAGLGLGPAVVGGQQQLGQSTHSLPPTKLAELLAQPARAAVQQTGQPAPQGILPQPGDPNSNVFAQMLLGAGVVQNVQNMQNVQNAQQLLARAPAQDEQREVGGMWAGPRGGDATALMQQQFLEPGRHVSQGESSSGSAHLGLDPGVLQRLQQGAAQHAQQGGLAAVQGLQGLLAASQGAALSNFGTSLQEHVLGAGMQHVGGNVHGKAPARGQNVGAAWLQHLDLATGQGQALSAEQQRQQQQQQQSLLLLRHLSQQQQQGSKNGAMEAICRSSQGTGQLRNQHVQQQQQQRRSLELPTLLNIQQQHPQILHGINLQAALQQVQQRGAQPHNTSAAHLRSELPQQQQQQSDWQATTTSTATNPFTVAPQGESTCAQPPTHVPEGLQLHTWGVAAGPRAVGIPAEGGAHVGQVNVSQYVDGSGSTHERSVAADEDAPHVYPDPFELEDVTTPRHVDDSSARGGAPAASSGLSVILENGVGPLSRGEEAGNTFGEEPRGEQSHVQGDSLWAGGLSGELLPQPQPGQGISLSFGRQHTSHVISAAVVAGQEAAGEMRAAPQEVRQLLGSQGGAAAALVPPVSHALVASASHGSNNSYTNITLKPGEPRTSYASRAHPIAEPPDTRAHVGQQPYIAHAGYPSLSAVTRGAVERGELDGAQLLAVLQGGAHPIAQTPVFPSRLAQNVPLHLVDQSRSTRDAPGNSGQRPANVGHAPHLFHAQQMLPENQQQHLQTRAWGKQPVGGANSSTNTTITAGWPRSGNAAHSTTSFANVGGFGVAAGGPPNPPPAAAVGGTYFGASSGALGGANNSGGTNPAFGVVAASNSNVPAANNSNVPAANNSNVPAANSSKPGLPPSAGSPQGMALLSALLAGQQSARARLQRQSSNTWSPTPSQTTSNVLMRGESDVSVRGLRRDMSGTAQISPQITRLSLAVDSGEKGRGRGAGGGRSTPMKRPNYSGLDSDDPACHEASPEAPHRPDSNAKRCHVDDASPTHPPTNNDVGFTPSGAVRPLAFPLPRAFVDNPATPTHLPPIASNPDEAKPGSHFGGQEDRQEEASQQQWQYAFGGGRFPPGVAQVGSLWPGDGGGGAAGEGHVAGKEGGSVAGTNGVSGLLSALMQQQAGGSGVQDKGGHVGQYGGHYRMQRGAGVGTHVQGE